jgi:hypothetical protein
VQYRPESLKDSIVGFRTVFCEEKSDFSHESNSYLDRVVGGSVETKQQNLQCYDLVSDVLVTQVGDEGRCGMAYDLMVSFVVSSLTELTLSLRL